MSVRCASLMLGLLAASVSPLHAEWNPALAARYLDARQQEWFAWKTAQSADGPCVSCHTGLTYLLARPVLRRALHEAAPTAFETGLAHEASRRGLQGVDCGHIHRAEMREIDGILYCNTGDWVESCTALVESANGTLELLSMAPAAPETIVARVALT